MVSSEGDPRVLLRWRASLGSALPWGNCLVWNCMCCTHCALAYPSQVRALRYITSDQHLINILVSFAAASRQEWSDFVGVPYDTQKEVNFMIFSDPRFSQVGFRH